MKKIVMALLASAALLSGCGKKDGAIVYLTREISPESLVRIYEALGVPATGRVAVSWKVSPATRSSVFWSMETDSTGTTGVSDAVTLT